MSGASWLSWSYAHLGRFLRPLPIWRMRIGRTDLGDLLDGLIGRVLPATRAVQPVRLTWGATLWLPPGYRDGFWYVSGILEPATTRAFQESVRPGDTVIDGGAHLGYYTLLASRLVGERGKVCAFEPDPAIAPWLRHNAHVNDCRNVEIVHSALGEAEGRATFYVQPGSSGSSLHRRPRPRRYASIEVRVTSLDHFMAERGWPRVHLIKLDIEGSEKLALEGMKETIRRSPSIRCIVEFELRAMRAAGVAPAELVQTLKGLGFERMQVLCDDAAVDLRLPEELPRLIRMAERHLYVNLLCERV